MTTPVRDSINQANAAFVAHFNSGDIAAAARVYSPDARIFPPGVPPIDGQETIAGFWQGAAEQLGVKEVQLTTVALEEHDDTAIEEGRFVLSGEAGRLDQGKYIVVWKRQPDGTWKWHRDIWNSNGAA
jgi:ketosteroid isomerase-like protein